MNEQVQKEIARLTKRAPGGLLHAEDVYEYAKDNPESALHNEFEWDVNEAARLYNIERARTLIRTYRLVVPAAEDRYVRALISVPSDRVNGGGYRKTQEVLTKDVLRQQVVQEALNKVEALAQEYSFLTELDGLFAELKKVIARHQKKVEAA